ncbi:MAG: ABC transporter substrate-binding protein [Butyricicoccus sp.]|nr:ABC transporter substrate-binding protein [Butyricicoccus sp.]
MKKSKLTALLLTSALLLSGCGGTAPAGNEAASVTGEPTADAAIQFTDMVGREIVLDEPAARVIALSAADCEIIYALGAEDVLIGRGEYCDWPAEVIDIPAVASGRETNIEQILSLQPDVLLMADMDQTEEQVAQLENAGITVVVSDADDIEGVYRSITNTGAMLGKDTEAAALVSGMKDTFTAISDEAADKGETVYFEVSPLQYGLWAAGADTFMNEIAEMMGLTNIFSDVSGWCEVSEEQVIERAPDYIVTISMYFGEGPTPAEEILSRAGWESIPAVANNKILNLANNELSRPGPRLADGAQALYDFISAES